MTDYKQLCAELVEQLDDALDFTVSGETKRHMKLLTGKARAALAESEPEGSTDEALASFTAWFCRNYPGPDTVICRPEWHAPRVFRAAAHAIARWGRQTAPPAEGGGGGVGGVVERNRSNVEPSP